jgi:hypothetical protein
MSRYKISATQDNHEVFVGWDAPMTTFFIQVFDRGISDPDEQLVVWIGDDVSIPTLQRLQDIVANHATIPTEIVEQLQADYDRAWSPSPLQQQHRRFINDQRRSP